MEEKEINKKSKGKTITIVILVLVIIGMALYIAYDKGVFDSFLSKNDTKEEKKEEKTNDSTNTLTDDEKKELDEKMEILMNMDNPSDAATIGLYYKQDKLLVSDMRNEEKLFLAFKTIEPSMDEIPASDDSSGKSLAITDTQLDTAMKNFFGKNVTYTNQSLYGCRSENDTNFIINREYNSSKKLYTITAGQCGSIQGIEYKYKIMDYKKSDNQVEVTAKTVLYVGLEGKVCQPSYDVYAEENDASLVIASNVEDFDSIDPYLDKLDTYKYTFNKEDNNYVFYSVEKVA